MQIARQQPVQAPTGWSATDRKKGGQSVGEGGFWSQQCINHFKWKHYSKASVQGVVEDQNSAVQQIKEQQKVVRAQMM